VAANVGVFVAMAVAGAGILEPEGAVHVKWGSNFGLATASGEWWRLFTSMFLHFGILHLALNMAALWDVGRMVERMFGNWTFLGVYLAAGVAGAIASLLWHPAVNSAGASGAIFGVFGMLAGYLSHRELGVPATIMKRHWSFTVPFIGYNLFIGATLPGIDNAAHLGGLATGLAAGYALARPLDPAARSFRPGRLAALAVVALVATVAAMGPLASVSESARAEVGVHEAVNAAIEADKAATAALKEVVGRLQARAVSPEAAAARIEDEGARRYEEAHRRLSSFALAAGSPQHGKREALVRYTALRSEGYRMLARAVRANDEALAAEAFARIEESNAVVAPFKGPAKR
jgi:rhomboid protease GluP